jgi:glycosyltransferase involved in cell wall biosynthesis
MLPGHTMANAGCRAGKLQAIMEGNRLPHVSVVIPAYNSAAFIGESLASVRAQTVQPAEILVVDDGSTDATREIAREAGAMVLQAARNGGPATARNLGIQQAHGELIAFLDADDLWEPEQLEVCCGLLERYPEAALAFSLVTQFGTADQAQPALLPEGVPVSAAEILWEQNPLIQSAAVARRDALVAMGGYRDGMRHAEDYDLWLRLAQRHPFVCTHRRLVRYRIHAAQHSLRLDQMFRSAWQLRHDLWRTVSPELSAEGRARGLSALHRAYEMDLATAWHQRSGAALRAILALHPLVPDGGAIHQRWAWRTRLLRPFWRAGAWLFDHLPGSLRQLLRPTSRAA